MAEARLGPTSSDGHRDVTVTGLKAEQVRRLVAFLSSDDKDGDLVILDTEGDYDLAQGGAPRPRDTARGFVVGAKPPAAEVTKRPRPAPDRPSSARYHATESRPVWWGKAYSPKWTSHPEIVRAKPFSRALRAALGCTLPDTLVDGKVPIPSDAPFLGRLVRRSPPFPGWAPALLAAASAGRLESYIEEEASRSTSAGEAEALIIDTEDALGDGAGVGRAGTDEGGEPG